MTTSSNHEHLKKTGKATGTFYFKQFKVEDGRSTMKVGTDAVLLGSAVKVESCQNILEIGTGSGYQTAILARMRPDVRRIFTIERLAILSERAESRLSALRITGARRVGRFAELEILAPESQRDRTPS